MMNEAKTRPSRSDGTPTGYRRKRLAVWMLMTVWLSYSGALLGWWAYTEPTGDSCIASPR